MIEYIKLKDNVNFEELIQYGFIEDPVNCGHPQDHYYHLNNYYLQIGEDFRITVNMISRRIDILCLSDEGLSNIFNLKPLYDLITNDLVEVKE